MPKKEPNRELWAVERQEEGSSTMANDPTYVKSEIEANPEWHLAWRLSEVDNDNAPIGWGRYLPMARWLLQTFEMTPKARHVG